MELTRHGRHPSAGSEDGSPFRRETIPTLAPDVPQPPDCQGALVLLPSRAPRRDGPPMDPAPRGRLQLRAREDERGQLDQGPRLLLLGPVVQERDPTPPAHVAAPASVRRRLAQDDDDGREG